MNRFTEETAADLAGNHARYMARHVWGDEPEPPESPRCGSCGGTCLELEPCTWDTSLLVGAVETHSADSHVTDSAASGTAYATGVKTRNWMLGVDPDERPLGTLLEAAEARGMSTGLVTTADLTDATPAAFVAHVARRTLQDSIAILAQQAIA